MAIVGAMLLARFGEHMEGWRLSLAFLTLFVLFSVIR